VLASDKAELCLHLSTESPVQQHFDESVEVVQCTQKSDSFSDIHNAHDASVPVHVPALPINGGTPGSQRLRAAGVDEQQQHMMDFADRRTAAAGAVGGTEGFSNVGRDHSCYLSQRQSHVQVPSAAVPRVATSHTSYLRDSGHNHHRTQDATNPPRPSASSMKSGGQLGGDQIKAGGQSNSRQSSGGYSRGRPVSQTPPTSSQLNLPSSVQVNSAGKLLAGLPQRGASYSNDPRCLSVHPSVSHTNVSETKQDRLVVTRKLE